MFTLLKLLNLFNLFNLPNTDTPECNNFVTPVTGIHTPVTVLQCYILQLCTYNKEFRESKVAP